MVTLGFLEKSSQFLESLDYRETLDPDWYKYIESRHFKYDDNLFHVSNPTHEGVHKAALKFDTLVKDPSDLGERIHDEAFLDLCNFFEPLRDRCSILPLEEVDYNGDATVALCGEILGSRTKSHMEEHNWEYLERFWRIGHLENYPTLWKLFGKVEFLKTTKLETRDIRSILTIPVELFFSLAAMCQDMNEKMCEPSFFLNTPSKHGINLLRGGFSALFKDLEFIGVLYHIIQGDCSKWDSRCMPFLLQQCKRLRYFCWDKKGMDSKEWKMRMDYYYDQIINTFFYTPSGEVFLKFLGQPSGTVSTTDDNIIMHLYVLCYSWRKLFGKSLFMEYRDHVKMAIYADDHIFTVSEDRKDFCSFTVRQKIYDHFGLILKLDDDKVSQSFEGHTFLGLTARKDYGKWVPTFKRERILNAVGKLAPGKKMSPLQKYERAMIYMLLATFDLPTFDVLQDYCILLKGKYPEVRHKILWSLNNCKAMWLGWEHNGMPKQLEGIKISNTATFQRTTQKKIRHCNMSTKSKTELLKGEITKKEFDKRAIQSENTKRGRSRTPRSTSKEVAIVPVRSRSLSVPRPILIGTNSQMQGGRRNMRMPKDSYINEVASHAQPRLPDKVIMEKYLKCLLENWNYSSRFPDSKPKKTATFTSVSSINVPLHLETSGEYRFSLAVQPQMGDLTTPDHFQAAVANTPSGATGDYANTDWSSSNNYLSLVNGRDPRLDINSQYLASGITSGFEARTQFSNAGALLAQPAPATTTGQNFQGPNLGTAVTSYTPVAAVGSLGVVQNADGSITIPGGSYVIVMGVTLTTNNAGLASVAPTIAATRPAGQFTSVNTLTYATPSVTQAVGTVQTCSMVEQVILTAPTKFYFTITKNAGATPLAANDISALVTDLAISPTNLLAPGPSNGAISSIRPVAQTVLVTYMGPTLVNGGRICGAYIPRGGLDSNYFTAAANTQGNYQFVENLANVQGAYDGPLRDGTFGFWTPYDESDNEFLPINMMNAEQWPGMVVSGVFNPVSAVTGNLADIVRVRLVTTFEFLTQSTAFEQQVCSGSQAIIDEVNRRIGTAPHFMSNKDHLDWIRSFLGGLVKYGPYVLRGAGAIASLL